MKDVILKVFLVLGSLIASLIIYAMIFSGEYQDFIWGYIDSEIQEEWLECSMNNGSDRTEIYEGYFDAIVD